MENEMEENFEVLTYKEKLLVDIYRGLSDYQQKSIENIFTALSVKKREVTNTI